MGRILPRYNSKTSLNLPLFPLLSGPKFCNVNSDKVHEKWHMELELVSGITDVVIYAYSLPVFRSVLYL